MKSSANKKNILTEDAVLAVTNALAEDIGRGDITTSALIDPGVVTSAELYCKENNVIVCGMAVFKEVFRQLSKDIRISHAVADGKLLKKGDLVCVVGGPVAALLMGERTALNFLGRLSGIATKTFRMANKIRSSRAKILDTRKTTPGLRSLEKYAVKTGGGVNHRFGLFDQVLIKDNHIAVLKNLSGSCSLEEIINKARKNVPPGTVIEIEVEGIKGLESALRADPDIIMLDNMNLKNMRKAVWIKNSHNKKIKLEASGNITEKNIGRVAACGIDFISIGALTHSASVVDFSLKIG